MLNKNMLLVRSFASTIKSRPELTGVYVQKDRVAATDSYILAEVRTKFMENVKPEDFPLIPGLPKARAIEEPMIIPANVADTIAKSIPKPHASLPILANAAFLGKDEFGNVTFATTNLETATPISFKPVDGKYPDYAPIIPTDKPKASVRVNAEYLLRAAKLLQEFNKVEGRAGLNDIEIEVRGEMDPLVIKGHGRSLEAITLIMPIKV